MIKCFVTGDNHFGKPYNGNLSAIKDKLTEARSMSLEKMVDKANEERCDLFIVTGDLFEKSNAGYIGNDTIKKVCDILGRFSNTVLVLPGNHDYLNETSTVWPEFNRCITNKENIIVLDKFEAKSLGTINGSKVVIYPAHCQSEHSDTNNLDWIKNADISNDDTINLGIAHGTLDGLSCDNEGVYFKMTRDELLGIEGIDAWFIGHAHVTYPKELTEDTYSDSYRIFNPGTHQQIHIGNGTDGYGFIVEIEKENGRSVVRAKKFKSGIIRFREITISVHPDSEDSLKNALNAALAPLMPDKENTVIRVTVTGSVKKSEYQDFDNIYNSAVEGFIAPYSPDRSGLSEEITEARIDEEFGENSFISEFLKSFINDPDYSPSENAIKLSMAYQLINGIRNKKQG